ncbi:MAG: NAD-dependent epimerase/dehydratase family protein [Bacilli bacterium]
MEKVYLVTGAAGHLGNTIVRKLLEKKGLIRVFILKGDTFPIEDKRISIFYGDVTDKETIKPFVQGLEKTDSICIHCAGIVSIASRYEEKVYQVNVNGTKNIMDACMENNIKRVIHVSSVHAIKENKDGSIIKEATSFSKDNVEGLYAKTKAEASAYVLCMAKKGLNVSIVHPSGIFGPGDYGHGHLTQLIIDYCNHRLTAAVKGGYDFVDVRDVADGIISCITKGSSGKCYILSNKHFEIKEILEMLHEITGHKKIKTILPIWFAKLTAPLSEWYYRLKKQPPLYTSYSLYTLTTNSLFTHKLATKELNYHPRPMNDTLRDTVNWLKEQGRINK